MTSLYPQLQFVTAPNEDAEVIADLNAHLAADVETLHDGFTLGIPSLGGEAGRSGRTWGKRRLQVPVHVTGARLVALDAHRQLARVATRDGWLRWQFDPLSPVVWFRTYATEPEPVEFEHIFIDGKGPDLWRFTLPLDADPFGIGAEVTLGPYTVTNTTASGGMRVTLPEIEGDMPAPARVKIERAGGLIQGPAVGVSAVAPAAATAASWGSAVGSAVTNASYIAGSYRPTTGALTDWTQVATFNPGGLRAGRWGFLTRLSGSTATGSFAVQVRVSDASGNVAALPPVVVDVVNQVRWVDLGQGPWPLSDASAFGVAHASTVTVWARRLEAGGELHFDDKLMLVPVGDDSTMLAVPLASDVATSDTKVLVDAEVRQVLAATSGATRAPLPRGGWPTLHPGRDNIVPVFQNLEPGRFPGRHDSPSGSSTVTVTYRPQYLWGVG